jgi:hypothetical protein
VWQVRRRPTNENVVGGNPPCSKGLYKLENKLPEKSARQSYQQHANLPLIIAIIAFTLGLLLGSIITPVSL